MSGTGVLISRGLLIASVGSLERYNRRANKEVEGHSGDKPIVVNFGQ